MEEQSMEAAWREVGARITPGEAAWIAHSAPAKGAIPMRNIYDCVWYWTGGSERGRWNRADAGTREGIERMGYVAYDGRMSIGPPDGAPTREQLDEAIRGRKDDCKRPSVRARASAHPDAPKGGA